MALTRKWLAAMGIEAEKIDEIVNANAESLEAIKADRDKYKADAEKLPGVQKELDELKEAAEKNDGKVWQTKYEAMKEEKEQVEKEFNSFKDSTKAKETKAAKETAYRAMLKELGVSEKRLDAVLRVTDLDKVELDDKGAIKDIDGIRKSAKEEWSDFIVTEGEKGANTATPPEGSGGNDRMTGRAAKIAAQYHSSLYGETPKQTQKGDN